MKARYLVFVSLLLIIAAPAFAENLGISCQVDADGADKGGELTIYEQALEPSYVALDHLYWRPSQSLIDRHYRFDYCKDRSTIVEYQCINGELHQTEMNCASKCVNKWIRVRDAKGKPSFWQAGIGKCRVEDPEINPVSHTNVVDVNLVQDPVTGTATFYVYNQDFRVNYHFVYGFARNGKVINKIPMYGTSVKLGSRYALSRGVQYFVRLEDSNGNIVPGGEEFTFRSEVQSQIRGAHTVARISGNVVALPRIGHNGHLLYMG